MSSQQASLRALVRATVVGTILQVLMVVTGHFVAAVAALFAVGGMGFSMIAGFLYARWAAPVAKGRAAGFGALAGAVCAFLGILVSVALGDVPVSLLAFGTLSSAVTGAIGGLVGAWVRRRPAIGA